MSKNEFAGKSFAAGALPVGLAFAVAVTVAPLTEAAWIGATSGSVFTTTTPGTSYLNTGNWSSGIDDDLSSLTLTGALTLFLNSDRTTALTGLNLSFNAGGGNNFTLQGTGGDRTLTLGGNVTFSPTASGGTFSVGNSSASQRLFVDLGNQVRTFTTGTASRNLNVVNSISNGGIIKNGVAALQLSSANTYGGSTTVEAGTLALNSAGSILSTSGITLLGGASLTLSPQASGNQIADTGAGGNILLRSGFGTSSNAVTLSYTTTTASLSASETLAGLTLQSGRSLFTHGPGNNTTTGISTILALGSLTRENGSLLRINNGSTSTGGSNANLGSANRKILITNAPTTGNGMLIGGDGSRTTNKTIVPFLMGYDLATSNNTFFTYGANGLTALTTGDYVTTTGTGFNTLNGDGNDNFRGSFELGANANGTDPTSISVNALVATTDTRVRAGYTLNVKSGAIMILGGNLSAGSSNSGAGFVDFGTAEGVIQTNTGTTTLSVRIAGSGGLTIGASGVGAGSVTSLTGANTYTGDTTVYQGVLSAENGAALADSGVVKVHPNATLRIGATTNQRTEELVGGLAGLGIIRMGNISGTSTGPGTNAGQGTNIGLNSKLVVGGAIADGEVGSITLAGGSISPGMTDSLRVGTLAITTEAAAANTAIPLVLKSGTINIDIADGGIGDLIDVTGSVTRGAGALNLNLSQSGTFDIEAGDKWQIIRSGSAISSFNFTNDPTLQVGGWNFDAYIGNSSGVAGTGAGFNSVWITATAVVPEPVSLSLLGIAAVGMLRQRRAS